MTGLAEKYVKFFDKMLNKKGSFLKINKLFTDVVKWAEDFSIFLSREKTNAERCLHDCERLLNDPNVTDSDSLRDGVRDLMSKTEDNFGTLLHLERVINMKNHGDISQQRTVRILTYLLCFSVKSGY